MMSGMSRRASAFLHSRPDCRLIRRIRSSFLLRRRVWPRRPSRSWTRAVSRCSPPVEPAEIERLRRFGELRSYSAGEALVRAGDAGHGLTIILSGKVDIGQYDEAGRRVPIMTHGPGSFMGELAQLSGRPSLVDGHAQEPVEA